MSERFSNTVQFSDNLTKVYKSHTFKTGYMYQHIFFGSTQPPYARGEYHWDGRYTSVAERHRRQHGARAVPAHADPVARARAASDYLGGMHEIRVSPFGDVGCVQDLPRRLRAGQLARLVEADGELRPALGLVQPRAGTRGRAGQHGARAAGTLSDSRRMARQAAVAELRRPISRGTASSSSTPTSSAAASARCRRTTSRRASTPPTSSARSTCCAPATACSTARSRTAAATRASATTIRSSSRWSTTRRTTSAPNPACPTARSRRSTRARASCSIRRTSTPTA